MIGCKQLPLQDTEPDFDLIKPRGVGGQPIDLNGKGPALFHPLLFQPAFQLLGGVGRPVVEDEDQGAYLPTQGLRDQGPEQESLEIHEPFALPTQAVDLSIGHTPHSSRQTDARPPDARNGATATKIAPLAWLVEVSVPAFGPEWRSFHRHRRPKCLA